MNEKYKKSLFCNEGGTPLSQNTKIILLDIGCQYNGNHKKSPVIYLGVCGHPDSPLFYLKPIFMGYTGFLRADRIYSSSLLKAASPGPGKGKINDSQWPCCRLLSASCQFFSP